MTVSRRAFTASGAAAAACALAACQARQHRSRAASATGSATAAGSGLAQVRELVRLPQGPSLAGVDWGHVSPAPATAEGTVTSAELDLTRSQVFFLWEDGRMPVTTRSSSTGADPAGFRPTLTTVPAVSGTEVKGAVLLCAGGAFQVRGDSSDCYPTAAQLTALGYHCFVVDYRVRPSTQAEAGEDLARAVRFVRSRARQLGLPHEERIALTGYSAGGILCGQTILHNPGTTSPSLLDPGYVPDELDQVSADVAATAMVYSFYGRLSVAELDPERLTAAVPTYYCYGTRDPFYDQFEAQAALLARTGVTTHARVLEGWPHGFGGEGEWVPEYDAFLTQVWGSGQARHDTTES